jgi:hypothetical protein|tara:strand:+ start:2727 stop:2921 length:195 start_codon:yes stop_codon:yes gene_type:complete
MTTTLSKKKLIKVLSGEQNRLEKQLQEWQDLADCIRSDQVPASDVAKFFQNKNFYTWYRKKYLR